jgi:xylose isomerase
MTEYFKNINPVQFEGPNSTNPLSYRYYDANKTIMGKTMAEHLRIAVCAWHTFCWQGEDAFGGGTFDRAWLDNDDNIEKAKQRVRASFEFVEKLGLPFFTFHDRDIAPEGSSIQESNHNLDIIADVIEKEMARTGIKLLWGTANAFTHRRYMSGAATNPNPEVFAFACAQVKHALDTTHRLNGENYVLWGGREGYDTLLNTDLKKETEQYARFLRLLVEYKHKIGFKGLLLIEPKPCEPTKHQYDYDCGHVLAFLEKYGLEKEFKVNIEANHATLAGHSFAHEIAYACAHDIFGSIDANRGDPQLGWDTDQFPIDIKESAMVIYHLLKSGGFTSGGFNFDTKLRRQSIDLEDMFYAHISGVDTLARGLLIAEKMIEQGDIERFTKERYSGWSLDLGQDIMNGKFTFEQIAERALEDNLAPQPISGRQELLEHKINSYL